MFNCSILFLVNSFLLAFCIFPTAFALVFDKKELGEFFDEHFSDEVLREYKIASAAISFVSDGEVLFFRGYGYEDYSSNISTSEETVFGIASISKTFLAVMLLQSLSKADYVDVVNFDNCVESYLPFRLSDTLIGNYMSSNGIPKSIPKRCVFIRDLITHTSGYDESTYGYNIKPALMKDYNIKDDIRENMPPRVRQPGVISSYSNYGVSMLGLAIQHSNSEKLSYGDYLRKNAFEALGMKSAYYGYDEAISHNKHVCKLQYRDEKNEFHKYEGLDFQHIYSMPSGGVLVDSLGMQKWIMTLLAENETKLLNEKQWKTLFRTQFSLSPTFPSIAVNLYHLFSWGQDWIGHDGDLPPYASEMRMHKASNSGYVLLMTGKLDGFDFRRKLLDDLNRKFYLGNQDFCKKTWGGEMMVVGGKHKHHHCLKTFHLKSSRLDAYSYDWSDYTGCYTVTRYPHTTWVKLPYLLRLFKSSDYSNTDGSFCVTQIEISGKYFLRITDVLHVDEFSVFGEKERMLLIPRLFIDEVPYRPTANQSSPTIYDFLLSRVVSEDQGIVSVEIDLTRGSEFLFTPDNHERKYWTTQLVFGSFEHVSTSPKWYIFTYYFAFALPMFVLAVSLIWCCVYLCTIAYACFARNLLLLRKWVKKKDDISIVENEREYERLIEEERSLENSDTKIENEASSPNEQFGIQKKEEGEKKEPSTLKKSFFCAFGSFNVVCCLFPTISGCFSIIASLLVLLHYSLIFFAFLGYYSNSMRPPTGLEFVSYLPVVSFALGFLLIGLTVLICLYQLMCLGKKNVIECVCCGSCVGILVGSVVIEMILYGLLAAEFNVFVHK